MRWLASCFALVCFAAGAAPPVEFDRDIRPVFSDRCYTCHGPDQAKRLSKLRFDSEESAKGDLGGRFAIVPGDPSRSELIRRISSGDKSKRMPPIWAGAAALSQAEIDLLTRWVQEGARWQRHWSFVPPVRPALPEVSDSRWVKNPVDAFVLARLDREGLKPSPEADRAALIRRVTLDLTGLPPTPNEVAAFERDRSVHAYENVVDRLLASPRYGERMAIRWLDAARYADTNGYQTDGERSMWRWRDWVIDAFNRNLPYDRFTVEQIAGDMLPDATRAQVIATGFNRNHRGNGEGGIIPEEYAVEYVVDRVDTVATVWMGLTLGCARCHNHRYDPITQKQFYQVFAYFNNVPERGNAFKYGNSPPVVPAPTREQEEQLAALDNRLEAARHRLALLEPEIDRAQRAWEQSLGKGAAANWAPRRQLAVDLPLHGDLRGTVRRDAPRSVQYAYLMENGPVVTPKPASAVIVPAWKGGDAAYDEAKSAGAFDGKRYVEVGNVADFGFFDSFTLAAWIRPSAATGAILSRVQDESEGRGFGLYLKDGRLQANLAQRWLDDGARVESEAKVPLGRWSHVALTYDGSRMADGIHIYLNGEALELKTHLDYLNQSFDAREPVRIGGGLGPANRFRGLIRDVYVYRAALAPEDVAVLAAGRSLAELAGIATARRTAAEAGKLRKAFLDAYAPPAMREARKQVDDASEERDRFLHSVPTVMVMKESAAPRETHVLIRGVYDRPGEKVSPGVPEILPPLTPGLPNNRLGFAKWLVDPSHPLTARVAVNRFWQTYFGTGLVKTVDDFGSQGEWPSHPELLDWMATEFVRSGWDMKAMQKLIVTSATYRQVSRASPELLQRDPENRLLARGPRLRLPAEMVRDQALAISGLLVEKVGGASVKPYQPPGLWKELTGGEDYQPDKGDGLHRRSLYTFWKRTAPPPTMMNFDAAGREACVVREIRTNTPLQSLDLMNNVTFLESARALAGRMVREAGATAAERIGYAFRLTTARAPKPRESDVLLAGFRYYLNYFRTNPEAAAKYLGTGETSPEKAAGPEELAAYATVASLILNLDVTLTKE